MGVAVEFEVEALVVGLQSVAQAQVQRLFELHDVRVQVGAVQHLLEGAEVAEVAFPDADDLGWDAVGVGHVDLHLVSGVEVVHVDGFEAVERGGLHAVVQEHSASGSAAAAGELLHAALEAFAGGGVGPWLVAFDDDGASDAVTVDLSAVLQAGIVFIEDFPESAAFGFSFAAGEGVARS